MFSRGWRRRRQGPLPPGSPGLGAGLALKSLPGKQGAEKEDNHQGHQEKAVAQQEGQQALLGGSRSARCQGYGQVLRFLGYGVMVGRIQPFAGYRKESPH